MVSPSNLGLWYRQGLLKAKIEGIYQGQDWKEITKFLVSSSNLGLWYGWVTEGQDWKETPKFLVSYSNLGLCIDGFNLTKRNYKHHTLGNELLSLQKDYPYLILKKEKHILNLLIKCREFPDNSNKKHLSSSLVKFYGLVNKKPSFSVAVVKQVDWLQSLKQFFINVSYHLLVASLTLMALFKTEPSELDWLQVYML